MMPRKIPSTQLGKMSFHGSRGRVLGNLVSERGIEVNKAKIELIEKLPTPVNIKGIRSFFGHAGK